MSLWLLRAYMAGKSGRRSVKMWHAQVNWWHANFRTMLGRCLPTAEAPHGGVAPGSCVGAPVQPVRRRRRRRWAPAAHTTERWAPGPAPDHGSCRVPRGYANHRER
jgi:hypothetical protein